MKFDRKITIISGSRIMVFVINTGLSNKIVCDRIWREEFKMTRQHVSKIDSIMITGKSIHDNKDYYVSVKSIKQILTRLEKEEII